MHLVQILLPVQTDAGASAPAELHRTVRQELVARFGGLTAYSRAPAKGLWVENGQVDRDDIVVYEVMVDELDREGWARYRAELEQRFAQAEVMIRALPVQRL